MLKGKMMKQPVRITMLYDNYYYHYYDSHCYNYY